MTTGHRPIYLSTLQRRRHEVRWLLSVVVGTFAVVAAMFLGLGYLIAR